MSEEEQDRSRPGVEENFLASARGSDEGYDQEFLEFVRERKRGSVLRPILMILVIFFVGTVIYDWRDEWMYFFHSSDPIEMGDIADYPVFQADDPQWKPPAGHNQFVSAEGIPVRVSRGGEYEFFRLIGGEFYVQRRIDEEDLERLEERSFPSRQELLGMGDAADRTRYEGRGRLMSFAKAPERFRGLKDHYSKRYGTRFCEDYTPRQQEELARQATEQIFENWGRRYELASSEERQERRLTAEPTEEEVADLLAKNPVCVNAYLIQDGQEPRDVWWHLLFSAALLGLIVFNLIKLFQWFRDWFNS